MKKNIQMIRGDTLAFAVKITFDEAPQALDTAYFTCKRNYSDNTPIFQKKLENGIYLADTTDDAVYYTVRVAPIDTKSVEAGQYYYDMQIGVNGDIYTILDGVIEIGWDVTRGDEASAELYQSKTVTPSTSEQIITADEGFEALSQVIVLAVPDGNNEAY